MNNNVDLDLKSWSKIPSELRQLILNRTEQFEYSDPWAFLKDAVTFRVKGAEGTVQQAYAETVLAVEDLENQVRLLSVVLLELWEVLYRKNEAGAKHLDSQVLALIDKIDRSDLK